MAFDIAQFRLDFPEFSKDTVYTDDMITFWSNCAEELISEQWVGAIYNKMVSLYTAHNITLQAANIAASNASGGIISPTAGAQSQKTVGSASVSYDTSSSQVEGAEFFNLTPYGKQYWMYVKMYGSNVVQI